MAVIVPIGVADGIAPVLVGENGQRVQTFFATGGGGGGAAQLIFATIAAMAAFITTSPAVLVNPGQQAFVQSNGSTWTLVTNGAIAADGITIVQSATAEPVKWIRENVSGYLPQALQQGTWVIDPQNVSGLASDENDGKTLATALLHKAEWFRRVGYTWSPTTATSMNFVYLSPDTDDKDPGFFAPNLENGAQFMHQPNSLPAHSFTGTLLAVTPKSRVAGASGALESTFTVATGAVVADMLLVNATRGNSEALAQANLGGGNWRISQPWAPSADPFNPTQVTVDTWANGDAITGYVLMNVNLAGLRGQQSLFANGGVGFGHTVYHLTAWDPIPGGEDLFLLDGAVNPLILASHVQRTMCLNGQAAQFPGRVALNASLDAAATGKGDNSPLGGAGILGGIIKSGTFDGVFLENDVIVSGPVFARQCNLGQVFVAPTITLTLDAFTDMTGAGSVVYGDHASLGNLNARSGTCQYSGVATTAFVCNLFLNGVTTGYSRVTAGGTGTGGAVTWHNLNLTPAALDAAAGAAGFGGDASGGGAQISRTGVQN
jgi:hypothetical protein